MWNIDATTTKNGNKNNVQQSIFDIKKLVRVGVVSLISGDWFFQVFGNKAVRKLRYSPEEFRDVSKYDRELDSIGVWVEREKRLNLTKNRERKHGNIGIQKRLGE